MLSAASISVVVLYVVATFSVIGFAATLVISLPLGLLIYWAEEETYDRRILRKALAWMTVFGSTLLIVGLSVVAA